jgi:drug/metabolite transporter (DMT)-like permease
MSDVLFNIFLSIFVAFCWGANAHIIKAGMKGENMWFALFLRSFFAFPLLFLLILLLAGIDIFFSQFKPLIFFFMLCSSIAIVIGDGLFVYALKSYPVSLIQPISSIYPMFSSFLLIIFGLESPSVFILIGTTTIFFGVYLVTKKGTPATTQIKKALLLGFIPALCWGFSIFFVKLIFSFYDAEALSITAIRIALIGLISVAIFASSKSNIDTYIKRGRAERINSMLFLGLSGVLGWAIAGSLFFITVKDIGAAIPAPITSTSPLFATLISYTFGLEDISAVQFFGILLCVVGTIIIVL